MEPIGEGRRASGARWAMVGRRNRFGLRWRREGTSVADLPRR